ncbi:peptidoglycan-recognition protein LA-like isoform X1 [Pieris napi]|uniref:peptidoglycan-recognition protein LA-like isoform X1 n=1 Tax=Pieris napi TaxID=78633 RepID=UPI001FBAFE80|nr:peptidoglycan-recognition protein LA-like isoform X1 [Pieris napi]
MEMNVDQVNEGIKVIGDLGDIQIAEISDNEECEKPVPSKDLSIIPKSLLQSSTVPVFGNISVSDSDNVQFGNNTYFNGPVTIKQVIKNNGVENASYTVTDDEQDSGVSPRSKSGDKKSQKTQKFTRWNKNHIIALSFGILIVVLIVTLTVNYVLYQNSQTTPSSTKPEAYNSTCNRILGVCDENVQMVALSIILQLTIMLVFLSLLTRGGPVLDKNNHENCVKHCTNLCTNEGGPDIISPEYLRFVSRIDWLAQPEEGALDLLKLPAPWVIITHTATETCKSQSECVLRVRSIQTFHIESRGWYDIGYNFLVGGDGSIYYGRGWDYIGSHTLYYNKYSIGIAFIGTFNTIVPPKRQIEACQRLIKLGVKLGKIAKDYKLLAHRQLMSTLSPGDTVFNVIKTWPHFVSNFTSVDDILPRY